MDNGTMRNSVVGAMLMRDVPLFNNEIVKFHVPYVMLKRQIRNRGIYHDKHLSKLRRRNRINGS